jgi:hypothetical protein
MGHAKGKANRRGGGSKKKVKVSMVDVLYTRMNTEFFNSLKQP